MDQSRIDQAFNFERHADILADIMNGKNLEKHQKEVLKHIEVIDFMIEQDGYMQPGIDDLLQINNHLKGIAEHIQKGLIDPTYKPEFIERINKRPGN